MLLKVAAKDVLEDLKIIDLQNDKEWQDSTQLGLITRKT